MEDEALTVGRSTARTWASIAIATFCLNACSPDRGTSQTVSVKVCSPEIGFAQIKGGEFRMGSDNHYPEEAPANSRTADSFSIKRTEVTNFEFSEFVSATGYITGAERIPDATMHPDIPVEHLKPGSAVFISPKQTGLRQWWHFVEGANWRNPEGPGSTIDHRMNHPVVHVSFEDALAYAEWVGADLPTEIEWEYAARGGLGGADYEWGDHPPNDQAPKANIWQGAFPIENEGRDGYIGTAPVGCFASNGFGLYDMTGNVWEWTKDTFDENDENSGLVKGGSFLCAKNFCRRYRPAARQPQERDFSSSHIGFRVVQRGSQAEEY